MQVNQDFKGGWVGVGGSIGGSTLINGWVEGGIGGSAFVARGGACRVFVCRACVLSFV